MSLHPTPRSGAGSAREEPQQPDISDALAMEMAHAMRKRMRLKKKIRRLNAQLGKARRAMEKKNHRLKMTVRREKGEPLETPPSTGRSSVPLPSWRKPHLENYTLQSPNIWAQIGGGVGPQYRFVSSSEDTLGRAAQATERTELARLQKISDGEHHRCAAEFTQFAQAALLNGVDLAATGHI